MIEEIKKAGACRGSITRLNWMIETEEFTSAEYLRKWNVQRKTFFRDLNFIRENGYTVTNRQTKSHVFSYRVVKNGETETDKEKLKRRVSELEHLVTGLDEREIIERLRTELSESTGREKLSRSKILELQNENKRLKLQNEELEQRVKYLHFVNANIKAVK